MSSQSLKEMGMTPTDCANLYVRYCLQNLPYNADAFRGGVIPGRISAALRPSRGW